MEDPGKKRKADARGAALFAEENQDNLACELKAIKSAMAELLDHSRSQTTSMVSMQREMNGMKDEVTQMRNEVKNLSEKGDLENAISRSLATESNVRFDEVDSRLKYHEVMLKNQKWEYSAPPPSDEYWDSIGAYDETLVDSARFFLEKIETHTCNMRHGQWEARCMHTSTYVAYDAAFLPHWKEFTNALKEHQDTLKYFAKKDNIFGSALYLFEMELPSVVLDLLSSALLSTHFQRIFLENNSFGLDGIEFALNCIQHNPILKEFVLRHNEIDEEDDFDRLCEIIKQHPSIETVHLVACKGDELNGFDMLHSIIIAGSNKLKDIDLSENDISTGGSTLISYFLGTNPILHTLALRGNELNDNDAKSIASALKRNTKLTCLDLNENPMITRVGWEALHKIEFDDTSLNSAADSNHTCDIVYPEELQLRNINQKNYDDWKAVRSQKIFNVLSSRNKNCSNVQHLGDVPLEIMPEMLNSIQKYSEYHFTSCVEEWAPTQDTDNDVRALSVLYEIMRKWDKALSVYESLSSCY